MERLKFVTDIAVEAGKLVVSAREKNLEVSSKNNDRRDVLTNVDMEVYTFVVEKIKGVFPDEAIYSEEDESSIEGKDAYWSVDPIDGTSNFARDIPHYATVVSYIEKSEAVVGAIYNPITKELFSFEKGKGAFLNGKAIHVSDVSALEDAYVLMHPGRKEEVRDWALTLQREFLARAKKNSNFSSSALDLAFLAAGREDVVIYGTMTTADIAVAVGLVREAGGEVYGIDGNAIELRDISQQVIATSTRALFEEIAKIS